MTNITTQEVFDLQSFANAREIAKTIPMVITNSSSRALYTGSELRQVHHREGQQDAGRIPSLINGKHVKNTVNYIHGCA